MKIVVMGGTGLIGSKTVAILRQRGHELVAASPNTGVNTITGEGLKEALAGAEVEIAAGRQLHPGAELTPTFATLSATSRLSVHQNVTVVGWARLHEVRPSR